MVVGLRFRPVDRRVAGSIPEFTNFLSNSSGQAIFGVPVHQAVKLVPESHSGEHLVAKRLYAILKYV